MDNLSSELVLNKVAIIESSKQIGLRKTEMLYGVTRKTIITWRNKFNKSGADGLIRQSRKKQFHPLALNDESIDAIRSFLRTKPGSGSTAVKKELKLNCSLRVITKKINEIKSENATSSTERYWQVRISKIKGDSLGQIYLLSAEEESTSLIYAAVSQSCLPETVIIFINHFFKTLSKHSIQLPDTIFFKPNPLSTVSENKNLFYLLKEDFPAVRFSISARKYSLVRNKTFILDAGNQNLEEYLLRFSLNMFLHNYLEIKKHFTKETAVMIDFRPQLIDSKRSFNKKFELHPQLIRRLSAYFSELYLLLKNGNISLVENYIAEMQNLHINQRNLPGFKARLLMTEGVFFLKIKKNNESFRCLTEALKFARQSQNLLLETECNLKLGEILLKLNKHAAALKFINNVISIGIENDFIIQRIKAYGLHGAVNEQLLNYKAALKSYSKQFELATINNYPLEYCAALNSLARLHYLNGQNDKALEKAEKGMPLVQKFNLLNIEIELHSTIGLVLSHKNQPRIAKQHFYKQLELSEKVKDQQQKVIALSSLGYCECLLNDFDNGFIKMEQAYKLSISDNNHASIMRAMSALAKAAILVKDFKKAVFYYCKIIRSAESEQNTIIQPSVLENLTIAYIKLKKYDLAKKTAIRLFDLVKFSWNYLYLALAYGCLGAVYLHMKDFLLAHECYKNQLAFCLRLNNDYQTAQAYFNLAELCSRQKKIKTAVNYGIKGDKYINRYFTDSIIESYH